MRSDGMPTRVGGERVLADRAQPQAAGVRNRKSGEQRHEHQPDPGQQVALPIASPKNAESSIRQVHVGDLRELPRRALVAVVATNK